MSTHIAPIICLLYFNKYEHKYKTYTNLNAVCWKLSYKVVCLPDYAYQKERKKICLDMFVENGYSRLGHYTYICYVTRVNHC